MRILGLGNWRFGVFWCWFGLRVLGFRVLGLGFLVLDLAAGFAGGWVVWARVGVWV